MEIVRIISKPKPILYSVQYLGEETHELYRNIDLWIDTEYLREFFKRHEEDLKNYCLFHNMHYSINDAVKKTMNDIEKLEEILVDKAENGIYNVDKELETLFKPLHNNETEVYPLQESKATLTKETWLRLYAIRIDTHLYVITGGAIKLTKTMNERDHTKLELTKMNQTIRYLRNKGLINENEFQKLEMKY